MKLAYQRLDRHLASRPILRKLKKAEHYHCQFCEGDFLLTKKREFRIHVQQCKQKRLKRRSSRKGNFAKATAPATQASTATFFQMINEKFNLEFMDLRSR